MSPELLRNIWLQLTPRRMLLMTGALVLAFFVAALPGGLSEGPVLAARGLYVLIVIVFGTRATALAIAGEIRGRTWDGQRLSAIGPAAMTLGKLLGPPIYFWYGGILCLATLAVGTAAKTGLVAAATETVFYLLLGICAEAAALLASLAAIRRHRTISGSLVFFFQCAGLAVAMVFGACWLLLGLGTVGVQSFSWWGLALEPRNLLLMSLGACVFWLIIGCYRGIRRELGFENGPLVWLSFLVFVGAYASGFGSLLAGLAVLSRFDGLGRTLALTLAALVASTYVMMLIEPKDRNRYRAIMRGSRRVLIAPDAFLMSYLASAIAGIVLSIHEFQIQTSWAVPALVAALLGLVVRDMAIFITAHARPRGDGTDGSAIAILILSYLVFPAIAAGLGLERVLFVFYPVPSVPFWLGATVAWVEASAAVTVAIARLSLPINFSREKAAPA